MIIAREKPGREDIGTLLKFHLAEAHENSPPGSVFALGMAALRTPDIAFWTARDHDELLGFGALKALDDANGEVKSMRTAPAHLRKGVGREILRAVIDEARARNYVSLSLETGDTDVFAPAHKLYFAHGFAWCEPFGTYEENDFSRFMRLEL